MWKWKEFRISSLLSVPKKNRTENKSDQYYVCNKFVKELDTKLSENNLNESLKEFKIINIKFKSMIYLLKTAQKQDCCRDSLEWPINVNRNTLKIIKSTFYFDETIRIQDYWAEHTRNFTAQVSIWGYAFNRNTNSYIRPNMGGKSHKE